MHLLHALPHDVTGRCMQLLQGLYCFDLISDIHLPPATLHIRSFHTDHNIIDRLAELRYQHDFNVIGLLHFHSSYKAIFAVNLKTCFGLQLMFIPCQMFWYVCFLYVSSLWLIHAGPCKSSYPGNTKGGSITVPLTSCLTSLD